MICSLSFLPAVDELPKETETVRTGEPQKDRVCTLQLSDVTAIIGNGEWRKQLLNDLAAIVLEDALKTGAHFLAVGDIVGNSDNFFIFELFRGIFAQRVRALRGSGGGADEPWVRVALGHIFGGGDQQTWLARGTRSGNDPADIDCLKDKPLGVVTNGRLRLFPRSCLRSSRCTHVGTGHASYLGDRVVGQIDRRMCVARLPKSLAFSDMPRM